MEDMYESLEGFILGGQNLDLLEGDRTDAAAAETGDVLEADDVELDAAIEEAEEVERPPTLADTVAAAVIGPGGYVTCPLLSWDKVKIIGRLTSWPAHKPEIERSWSMKCMLHPGCSSPAKRRHAVSNELFLSWLFQGSLIRLDPAATQEQQKRDGVAHRALWPALCRQHQEALAAAARAPLAETVLSES